MDNGELVGLVLQLTDAASLTRENALLELSKKVRPCGMPVCSICFSFPLSFLLPPHPSMYLTPLPPHTLTAQREEFPDLAPMLWHSCGTIAALLQEIIGIYPALSPPTLSPTSSNRVCNALALLQCVASHPETRSLFLQGARGVVCVAVSWVGACGGRCASRRVVTLRCALHCDAHPTPPCSARAAVPVPVP